MCEALPVARSLSANHPLPSRILPRTGPGSRAAPTGMQKPGTPLWFRQRGTTKDLDKGGLGIGMGG